MPSKQKLVILNKMIMPVHDQRHQRCMDADSCFPALSQQGLVKRISLLRRDMQADIDASSCSNCGRESTSFQFTLSGVLRLSA